ncbi:hypothetical protein K505DRAFT_94357 [Melanomma pulvis-pyrius CBS 109.77]|uniref:MYND-type domain-containing protein n=1 Tax=Melanomma pulvis-pyrius CBS 109.77 TaxID=1314802 RepID=A0A6A6XQV5_9PLEO|nr:hypothetical protein K505DRAFT_94357 [Melanomma pulvis-pyrius CBS 109.77]
MSDPQAQSAAPRDSEIAQSDLVLGDASQSLPRHEEQTQSQPETAPSSSTETPASLPPTCSNCTTPITSEKSKPCPRCHTTLYCSRDCLKADFKKHKKGCAELAQKYAENADVKMATTRVPPRDSRRGGLQKWQFDT